MSKPRSASVPPQGLRSPMLLGGPHAQAFVELAAPLNMQFRVFSERIGEASSVKMCRSVMIKGLEALTTNACSRRGTMASNKRCFAR